MTRKQIKQRTKADVLIGIDPDATKSGVAVYDKVDIQLYSLGFWKLLGSIKGFLEQVESENEEKIFVRLEAGWLNSKSNFHPASGPNVRERIAKNVGMNHQTGILIAEWLEHMEIPFELVKPPGKRWKTHKDFVRETGYDYITSTNQDQRDAAFLVWGF